MSVRAARPGALETAGVPQPATRDVILDVSERLFSAHGVDGVAVFGFGDIGRAVVLDPPDE